MAPSFGICNLAVIPLRAEASDRSEIKTQLLFGDHFEVLELQQKWARIRTAYDDYEGWIDPKQFSPIDSGAYQQLNTTGILTDLVVSQPLELPNDEQINLVPGSVLPFYDQGSLRLNGQQLKFYGKVVSPDTGKFLSDVESAAKFYLHTPYLWGGKTTFGIDCSGLTQMVFKHFGIKIKRDAWQQEQQGTEVSLTHSKLGDLAFFDNDEGRVIHVGILLNNTSIIHASGRVKIDRIDENGIYSEELGRYTHKLKSVKRFA